jgi:DHA1 family inner membrane transport protein
MALLSVERLRVEFPTRRGLLVALMVAYAAANALSAVASSYGFLLVARFVDGLPHGAYFGVASLVAASLAPQGRQGRAVAMVMIGLSVANVLGVPAATWLGQNLGWRSAFSGVLLPLGTSERTRPLRRVAGISRSFAGGLR